jgi:hypothetical protein
MRYHASTTCRTVLSSTPSAASCSLLHFWLKLQNLTPLSRPLYIEIEGGNPSPYLKELLSKVGSSEIEFMDFTLEGPVSHQ